MQLTKMATGITPAKRKQHVSLSCVLDMLDESPAKRRRTAANDKTEDAPEITQPPTTCTPVRQKLKSISDVDEGDSPTFEIRSFYNAKDRVRYMSPMQRKDQPKNENIIGKVTLSKSVGSKISARSQEKHSSSSKTKSLMKKAKARNTVKQRLPLKETSSIAQEKNKLSVILINRSSVTKQTGKNAVKDELRFKLNVKPLSTPVVKKHQPSQVQGTDAYDFDEPLTWDVEKTTPISEKKKFFKHRSLPGLANSSLIENGKGTSLVVQQGFKLKFIHNRGENCNETKSAINGWRNSLPAKLNTIKDRKNGSPIIPASAKSNAADDAMMKKLKEELEMKSTADDLYAYASSSDESQSSSVIETKPQENGNPKSKIQPLEDYTPELFSQPEQTPSAITTCHKDDNNPISATKVSVSSDSAIHTGQSVMEVTEVRPMSPVDLSNDDLSSGRSSPSVLSEMSATSPAPSDISGPTLRTRLIVEECTKDGKKLFPIFSQGSTPKQTSLSHLFKKKDSPRVSPQISPRSSPRITKLIKAKDNKDQLIIDAGQKHLGASQCEVCGMIFSLGDTVDEATHAKFHQILLTSLKFPGWKKERVVQEFPENGGRVLLVLPDDPKYATKKVEEVNKIMAQELGFSDSVLSFMPSYKVFFYISDEKKVVGCCVAEPVTQGYRVIPDSQSLIQLSSQPSHRPWCCQTDPELTSVGISRIWVFSQARRLGVATKLLECVRHWFEYGVVIDKEQVAFSDPTPDGKQLATKYSGTPAFLVYKYN